MIVSTQPNLAEDESQTLTTTSSTSSSTGNNTEIIKNQVRLAEASEKVFVNAKKCGLVYHKLFNEHFRVLWNKKQDRYSKANTTQLQILAIIEDMFGYTKFSSEYSITDVNMDNIPDANQFFELEEKLYTNIRNVLYSGDIKMMTDQQRKLKLYGMTDDLTMELKDKLTQNKNLLSELCTIINECDDDFSAVYDIVSNYVDTYDKYVDSTIVLIDQQTKL